MLFSPGSDSSADEDEANSHGGGDESEEMAPGTAVEISAEGYADDIYMLAMCAITVMLMLQATGQWTTLTGQEINVKRSLAFAVQHTARGTKEAQDVELNGETLPKEHEFRQLGIGLRMHPEGHRPTAHKADNIEKVTIPPLGIPWAGVNGSSDDHRGNVVWSRTSGHLQEDGGGTGVHGHVCAMGPKQTMSK